MFDAANVPVSARKKYYNEFNSYIYNLKQTGGKDVYFGIN